MSKKYAIITKTDEKGICGAPKIYDNLDNVNVIFINTVITEIDTATNTRYFPAYTRKYGKSIDEITELGLELDFLGFMTNNYACAFDKERHYFFLKAGCKRLEIAMHIVSVATEDKN